MNRHVRLFAAAAVMAVLSACGAKGPLFMPEKPVEQAPVEPAPPETTPPETTPAPVTDTPPAQTPPIDPATVPATGGNG